MRILFCGDIVGQSGRQVLIDHLPDLRECYAIDFVIVNGENAAGGNGITEQICQSMFQAGADVITGGNHSWDKPEITGFMESERRMLRPINSAEGTPGRGIGSFSLPSGEKVRVVNVMGQRFMEPMDNPFTALEKILPAGAPKPNGCAAIVVDVHAEATSEKTGMGHLCDGRATLVVGTHTHIPTADARILPGGTAYHSDAGMCGDYESVIGMGKEEAIARMRRPDTRPRLKPALGPGTLCGTFVETDPRTGLAAVVAPVRIGGVLSEALPPAPGSTKPESLTVSQSTASAPMRESETS